MAASIRRDLLSRLEAADSDYRDACERARRAAVVVLLAAILHLGLAAIFMSVVAGVMGLSLAACFLCSRRWMVGSLAVALALWVTALVLDVVLSPGSMLLAFLSASAVATLFGRILVLVILARGYFAARDASRMLRQRAAGSIHGARS